VRKIKTRLPVLTYVFCPSAAKLFLFSPASREQGTCLILLSRYFHISRKKTEKVKALLNLTTNLTEQIEC